VSLSESGRQFRVTAATQTDELPDTQRRAEWRCWHSGQYNSDWAADRQTWINLCQTKTKMITRPFYTYRQIHFTSEMLRLRHLSVIMR